MKTAEKHSHWNILLLTAAAVLIAAAGLKLYVNMAKHTCALIDGKEIMLQAGANSREDIIAALEKEKVALGPNDIILPPVTGFFSTKLSVRIIRVSEKIEKVEDKPEYHIIWKKKFTNNLRPVELRKVKAKRIIRDEKVIYHDSLEKERTVVKERTLKETVYLLALLNQDGPEEKVYDLSRCRKMKMVATAYYPGDPLAWRDGTITFLGRKMQRGVVAVDPAVIPLKTRVYVPGFGYGFAGDTGSAIKGKRVDLGVNNAEEEKEFMHKRVVVYILEAAENY
ncbi:MAG TPA: hypothetical protein DEE98_04460 [Elusimicrobia bacterium]|nr:MAG: hypothetical protein A2278_08795 [Elusimicrobia bacterium RIFOXYA12_FULL_49_49]OGS14775.1 MAG: hypothetical protein A2251_09800 [Elusimicrobia bacterium RIFOXYA2_FULL_47_53]OGS25575.1 MAG: hypothetical protein A2339_05795 [Elusimicrobia bacterium RIFOXYB12_FULL_50_12]OGS28941.1 MAG: hypothetical protein A2323_05225 [Elusimicrobia bacterium RIFOXYB2_FULL_46_23]HBU69619.1 hypothetical protein [Elusimicrobiota bacterium]